MKHRTEHLPDHWIRWIESRYGQSGFSAAAFDRTIELEFEDGSCATFKYSIAVVSKHNNELLLLTEHCSYHLFQTSCIEVCNPPPDIVVL